MSKSYSTPGVYIQELSAFPNSAVAVPTAVPAFVGYTEKHIDGTKSLKNVPKKISSINEYHHYFGGAPHTQYILTKGTDSTIPYMLKADPLTKFYLYYSVRLFFANGGSTCYIVSVDDYTKGVEAEVLNAKKDSGIHTLLKENEPTMLVIPDAVLLKQAECYALQREMLLHCGEKMKNRIALFDIFDGYKERSYDTATDVITAFRERIGNDHLQWGTAYYPWVETTVVSAEEVTWNIKDPELLKELLHNEAALLYPESDSRLAIFKNELEKLSADLFNQPKEAAALHEFLLNNSTLYKSILNDLLADLTTLPPSGGIAGLISMVDNSVGVHKAPANVSMAKVIRPTVNITNTTQEDLNLPLNGKAVNAIRNFPGQGILVWGARTLDGNSEDWRYLNVRRTMIMLEQSLKLAALSYVFEPNVSNTWVTVKTMMTNFLTEQWKLGVLVGAAPEDAFSVEVGLGVTMTPIDILDGIMNISIKLVVTRPAEFIVITIQQMMQKS